MSIKKGILFTGAAAVGKTTVIQGLITGLKTFGYRPCVCKIDCLHTEDQLRYEEMGVPCVVGLSGDLCPDHYLVSNFQELFLWGKNQNCDLLMIETAGLCHRCSPATEKTLAVCVIDCTSSLKSPQKLGPMLTLADAVVLMKIDQISQAEREIVAYQIGLLNPSASIFPVDGLSGYGIELLSIYLAQLPDTASNDSETKSHHLIENDLLRHTMPSGVCSYCIGERRIGPQFQQGVVEKIF